jgi:uncharacterized protein
MIMEKVRLFGRGAVDGIAEGYALVCPESIQGWSGLDDETGCIIETGHSQEGKCIDKKILVLPGSKGSIGWSCHFNAAHRNGKTPAGWIFTTIDSRCGVGAAVLGIPMVCDFQNIDPCKIIRTGDWVKINGSTGEVIIASM